MVSVGRGRVTPVPTVGPRFCSNHTIKPHSEYGGTKETWGRSGVLYWSFTAFQDSVPQREVLLPEVGASGHRASFLLLPNVLH